MDRVKSLWIAQVVSILLLAAPLQAQRPGPWILYSDLTSGPNTGGENNHGAIVTLYGNLFGRVRGGSTVTVGAGEVADYKFWSDTKIVVALGEATTTGNIVVHTGAGDSNGVPFTVRPGNIYCVSTKGNDSNSGRFPDQCWKTMVAAEWNMAPGDITYVMDGVRQVAEDDFGAALALETGGSADAPMAFVAYPGARVVVGGGSGEGGPEYGIRTPYMVGNMSHWVIAGLKIGGQRAIDLAFQEDFRIVGNDIACSVERQEPTCVHTERARNVVMLGNNVHSVNQASGSLPILIGDSVVESQVDSDSVGQAEAFQATATGSGSVDSISIYLDSSNAATKLYVGIYSDSSGHPGTLLGQGSSTSLAAGKWNNIPVSPINVTSGNPYWIALLGTKGGHPAFRDRYNASCVSETSAQTQLTSLPASWTTGTVWLHSCPLSAYGLDSGPPPPSGYLTASPSSINFGNVVVGNQSTQQVTLTNTGGASVTITAANVTGTGFSISGLSLPLTLNPSQQTSFNATFAPQSTGPFSGNVAIISNASNSPTNIPLSGYGVNVHWVNLTWTASDSQNVVGYNVYRGVQHNGPYTKINTSLITGTAYTDNTVQAGQTYYYVATAVDNNNNESVYSNEAQAQIPLP
jgi:hypothetical protein